MRKKSSARSRIARLFLGLLIMQISTLSFALSGQAYMDRFTAYMTWNQQLPFLASAPFLNFIQENSPLSNKLRDKWLYELARVKDWGKFLAYYQPSKDINLICYYQMASLEQGRSVLFHSIPFWLSSNSQTKPCSDLFAAVLKREDFDPNWLTQSLAIALDKRQIAWALYLLKQYKIPRITQRNTLIAIHQHPHIISTLGEGEFHDIFTLYGLKRLISINMEQALALWQQSKIRNRLSEPQQQNFLAHVALYKAMRNHENTGAWFAKVKPPYYNEVLLDWQIRFALKKSDWKRVEELIGLSESKESPCWQYWLARALEEQGKKEQAKALYEELSKNRQYYGFLSSMRLKKSPDFENEKPSTDLRLLKPYQALVDQVKVLYQTKQNVQASRLLNDFISELPKEEASALVYWVDSSLGWYGKSVYLSNNETLNNQLTLRFPLAYKNQIGLYAKKYAIAPEFVYAIIRQESGFREDVVSSVGARGLMQVMPYTAHVVSVANKIPYRDPAQLFLSEKNIQIGVAYLQQLTKRFGNHPILVAAAYNAGPKQVVYWSKNHTSKEIDVWIDTLPWQETRNYLKNVMAFYLVYQYRLQQSPNWRPFLASLPV